MASVRPRTLPGTEAAADVIGAAREAPQRLRLLVVPAAGETAGGTIALLAKLDGIDAIVSARAEPEAVARSAEESRADLLLLVLGASGAEGLRSIAGIVHAAPRWPLVALLPRPNEAAALEAVRLGAQDCLEPRQLKETGAAGALRRLVLRHRLTRQRHEREPRHAASTAAAGVLDRLPLGVMILDARGQVLIANARARRIVAAGDGLMVDAATGAFRADSLEQNKAMLALVRRTIAGEIGPDEGCALTISRPSLKQPLNLMVTPLAGRGQGEARRAGVAIFLSDPEDGVELEEDVLRDLYGLTRVEARLALGLVSGRQLDELAREGRVSVHTVRSQLKQIFRKTGTNRQAEVVKLLLTGPAAIRVRSGG